LIPQDVEIISSFCRLVRCDGPLLAPLTQSLLVTDAAGSPERRQSRENTCGSRHDSVYSTQARRPNPPNNSRNRGDDCLPYITGLARSPPAETLSIGFGVMTLAFNHFLLSVDPRVLLEILWLVFARGRHGLSTPLYGSLRLGCRMVDEWLRLFPTAERRRPSA